jgi:hypothetical protein
VGSIIAPVPQAEHLRIYYALLWRSIGFGKFTEGKSLFGMVKGLFVLGSINGPSIAVTRRSRRLMQSLSPRCSISRIIGLRAASDRLRVHSQPR